MMRLFLAVLFLAAIAGCGKTASGPAVEGVVTYDAQPLANANVMFIPQGETMGQAAFGKTDAAGKFTLGSADGKTPGAAPGEYKVVISKHVKPDGSDYTPQPDEDPMLAAYKELLPAVYSDAEQTKLDATVPADGKKDFSFSLTKSGSGS